MKRFSRMIIMTRAIVLWWVYHLKKIYSRDKKKLIIYSITTDNGSKGWSTYTAICSNNNTKPSHCTNLTHHNILYVSGSCFLLKSKKLVILYIFLEKDKLLWVKRWGHPSICMHTIYTLYKRKKDEFSWRVWNVYLDIMQMVVCIVCILISHQRDEKLERGTRALTHTHHVMFY